MVLLPIHQVKTLSSRIKAHQPPRENTSPLRGHPPRGASLQPNPSSAKTPRCLCFGHFLQLVVGLASAGPTAHIIRVNYYISAAFRLAYGKTPPFSLPWQ